jgi:hypothetical protein
MSVQGLHQPLNALGAAGNVPAARDLGFSLSAEYGGINPRPTELLALRYGALKASMNTLADYAALKHSESAADLEHQPTGRCGGVDRLLVEVQVDAAGLQRLDGAQQID